MIGAHINTCDNKGDTPLHRASQKGHLEVVKYLIGIGAQIDRPNKLGTTALLTASLYGHLDVVDYLVGQGGQVGGGNNKGVTALQCASHQGHLDVVEYLISHGVQVDRGDNDGVTPLHAASQNNHLDVVKYLIGNGAQIDTCDNSQGQTPLHSASMKGNLDVVDYLVGQGAQIDKPNKAGTTARLFATTYGHLDIVQYLVGKAAKIDKPNETGSTALHAALTNVHLDEAQRSMGLGQGAQEEGGDDNDTTPLHSASYEDHLGIVQLLNSEQAQRKEASHKGSGSVSEASTAMASMSLKVFTNGIVYQEDLAKVIDNREQLGVILLNVAKALDEVPHGRLLHKLDFYNIRNSNHAWIADFLRYRTQQVVLEEPSLPSSMWHLEFRRVASSAQCHFCYQSWNTEASSGIPSPKPTSLDMIQRRYARFVCNEHHRTSSVTAICSTNYSDHLCKKGEASQRAHEQKLQVPYARTQVLQKSFFPDATRL
ncbi:ankyrin repeat domain-containing protein 50-like [Strongylocentrotus purpuratus]|uniref:Uncharacterized protein n=1 Tax=Strongylocentrotus purpuratus TaxID=7668 RepID=A0A7M7P174_STRPU|nr:ankyrin repeat domain-containing protein 50-like [Strongylocentrotus purpuratus]